MANPQVEDGHTRIANELLDKMGKLYLKPNDWQILICLFRKTYGYQKKSDYITNSQIVEFTGLDKSVVCRGLKNLADKKLINRDNGVISIQKDWEQWQLTKQSTKREKKLTKQSTGVDQTVNKKLTKQSTNNGKQLTEQSTGVDQTVNKKLTKQSTTKERKKLIQKKGNISFKEKTLEIAETLRGKYPNLDFDHQMEKFMAYWFEGGRQLKNPKLAIMNWMDRASEFKKPINKSTWGVV